jgi:hypothetical protein
MIDTVALYLAHLEKERVTQQMYLDAIEREKIGFRSGMQDTTEEVTAHARKLIADLDEMIETVRKHMVS